MVNTSNNSNNINKYSCFNYKKGEKMRVSELRGMRINTLECILLNGGGNYSNGELIEYNSGYMVSIKDIVKINLEAVSTLNVLKVIDNIISTFDIEDTDCIYGFWIDRVNKQSSLYIDISINIPNLEDAVKIGVSNKQLAIWDCNLNESITL